MNSTSTTKPIKWKGWFLASGKPHWRCFPSTFHVAVERDRYFEIVSSHRKIGVARKSQKRTFGSVIIRANLRPEHNEGGIQHVPWVPEEGRVDEVYEEDLSWLDNL
jgi:hypothetical protein